MDITKDIQPVTRFRHHSAELMGRLKATGRPLAPTLNGKAAAAGGVTTILASHSTGRKLLPARRALPA